MAHLPKHFNRESIDWTRVNRSQENQQQNLRLQQQRQPTAPEVHAPPPETITTGIQQGDLITCYSGRTYTVLKHISFGPFGAIYQIKGNGGDKDLYALKEEKSRPNKNFFKLEMELKVLQAASRRSKEQQQHFPILYDQSLECRSSMFIVMSLLGDSLAAIKAKQPMRILSINSGLYCGIQMLESIKQLHDLGFVHLDVKPSNFVLGRSKTSSQNIVHIIDFGNARKIVADDGRLEIPRKKASSFPFLSYRVLL
uniref:non-specific serine/threonine protein kinase n=1 Tax=Meloidogyne incognita TaxID=6306 RepID=A0A914M323_MELIC